MNLFSLVATLEADTAPFERGLKNAEAMIAGFGSGVAQVVDIANRSVERAGAGAEAMAGALAYLSGPFSGEWGRAWQGVADMVAAPFDGMEGALREPFNAVIALVNGVIDRAEAAVNGMIGGINAIRVDLPGGEGAWRPRVSPVSWDRVQALARGGVVPDGGSAIVGEVAPEFLTVRNGSAVVTPLGGASRSPASDGAGRDINIILELDGMQFARAVYRANNDEAQRVGARLAGVNA